MKFIQNIKAKPFITLWGLAFMFLVYTLYSQCYLIDTTLDINVHDTYYVIAHRHVCNLLFIWFGLCGLGYWVLSKFSIKLIDWLTIANVVFSLIGLFRIILPINIFQQEPRYYTNTAFLKVDYVLSFFLFFIGQIIYFLNVFLSIIKKSE
ncbi:hypothetical protein [uncultured Maribacter sp.]|uniref:hypothetical protein n=1 Tax=uncultured Maribacter sp. TaxID=431308 RepID=UPI00261F0E46|nr:hypothetical protein [uncultured Maribacter sp.]